MNFKAAVTSCFNKYVTFSGRAPRSEFWYFGLFMIIGYVVTAILDTVLGTEYRTTGPDGEVITIGYLYLVFALAVFLPSISATVRRLHDKDRSGWWYWIILVPLIGAILLLVWFCQKGTTGSNRFGEDPLP